ncbi:hypothetical protein SLS60_001002 [Paraconiothyrium brasiliense]|uniref:Uncharacterized protein n=1 Tax=Paraconiothyrium brasiliense TaxID=300254 RepID=A0ABR3S7V5_9PLEO
MPNIAQWKPQKKKLNASFFGVKKPRQMDPPPAMITVQVWIIIGPICCTKCGASIAIQEGRPFNGDYKLLKSVRGRKANVDRRGRDPVDFKPASQIRSEEKNVGVERRWRKWDVVGGSGGRDDDQGFRAPRVKEGKLSVVASGCRADQVDLG